LKPERAPIGQNVSEIVDIGGGYGLVSPVNATVITTLALGAIAVASAIFLIIELSQPHAGLFRIPPGGLIETIQALGA
jgi:hypothetical protein